MNIYDETGGSLNLTRVAELDMSEPNYDFDIVAVWKTSDGTHYWGADAGCSCPSPFEDFNKIEDFTLMRNDHDFELLRRWVESSHDLESRIKFLDAVRESMRVSRETENP